MPRPRLLSLVVAAALVATALALSATPARAPADDQPYILALGDSLAAGDQPDARGIDRPTSDGYVTVLARRLRRVYRGAKAVNLSCGGETTSTILNRTGCEHEFGSGSQVQQAERLLAARPGAVLVIVDVGDNDVERCVHTDGRGIDRACVARGGATLEKNLPVIAQRIRAAAGPNVRVVGLTDYDQYLALWLDGAQGRADARASVPVIDALNAQMTRIYTAAGISVANAGDLFSTHAFSARRPLPGHGTVPLAVERICRWTWACSDPPIGHDDHANAAGYRIIAQAILNRISRPGGGP